MNKDLFRIAKHAYGKVGLYNNYAREVGFDVNDITEEDDFSKIPVIEKKCFVEDNESAISAEYMIKFLMNELALVPTSGSTGKCLEVYWSKQDYSKSLLSLISARYKRYGIKQNDRMCFFYSRPNEGIKEEVSGNVKYQIIGDYLGINKNSLILGQSIDVYNLIIKFNPVWMDLQPSIAYILANCKIKYGLENINELKYIELTGEMLFNSTREYIKDVFGCMVANQYGCNEVNSIAFECQEGNMHCMSSNVYVEVISNGKVIEDGEEGNIYITSLKNSVMPFVRYGTGDSGAIFRKTKCRCGNSNPILRLTKGRCNDLVKLKGGTTVSAYVFIEAIEETNIMLSNVIKQFKITQNDYDLYDINLVIAYNDLEELGISTEDIETSILEKLNSDIFNNAEVSFYFCNDLLPDEMSGKLRYFICNI